MKYLFTLLFSLLFSCQPAMAAATKVLQGDTWKNALLTKTWTPPSITDTIAGLADIQTFTNKAINGSNNTITNVSLTSGVTGTLPVANGGTGATTLTIHGVLLGNTTGAIAATAAGASNTVLHGNTGADPSYSAVALASDVSGTLPLANGGTNNTAAASAGSVVYSDASKHAYTAVGSASQILQSAGTGTPTWSTATYPATTTASQLLYSSGTNVVAGLATAATSALVTNSSSVPSLTSGSVANRVLRTDGTTVSFAQVAAATDVTGLLPVANGSTGQTTYTKGDLLVTPGSTTINKLAVGTDAQVLTADAASTNGVKWAATTAAPTSSVQISNLGLATSVGSSALTIAVKQSDGSTDPSTGASAVNVGMRSVTLTSGLYNQRSITAALSLVISSGSTLGQTSAKPANIYIYLLDNAGALELAASGTLYPEVGVISSTAEGGAGAADSNTVVYSTTARTNVPYRYIGVLTNTQTTAGTWASAGTTLGVGSYGTLKTSNVPTIQRFTSGSSTYYAPAGVAYIKVKIAGGGGGGQGGGTSGGNGGTGGTTTFGSSLLTAVGGTGGTANVGGAGGTSTVSSVAQIVAVSGGSGSGSNNAAQDAGGPGGNNPFGGGGGAGAGGYSAGLAGATNTGGGGGGSGETTVPSGAGGGAGGYLEALITSPGSYATAVGAAGTAGTAGTGGGAGGAGGSGVIIVEEYYF